MERRHRQEKQQQQDAQSAENEELKERQQAERQVRPLSSRCALYDYIPRVSVHKHQMSV